MERSFRFGVLLVVGVALVALALVLHAILLEANKWTWLVGLAGVALTVVALRGLRTEMRSFFQRRRGEIALYTAGLVGVLVALAYLTNQYTFRIDMTEAKVYSLSPQTATMLSRLDKPVKITFFHDPMMRETVELYQMMADRSDKVKVEFFDPMVNPAQARMMGVQFAGTAVMESEGRRLQVNGPSETEIANGILRISRGITQRICFLDGHGEPDPFSMESHDHTEGEQGHSHGMGQKLVVHEQHGMAKARTALEAMNYVVEKVSLMQASTSLEKCAVLVIAGPKSELLPAEVDSIRRFVAAAGNVLFMLDPFVKTGLEPALQEFGVIADNDIVLDEASHFWADPSAPAVSDYNPHQITRDLPLSFFPGARSLSPTAQRVAGTSATPLANTSKNSFGETTADRAEYTSGKDLDGPLTLMVSVTRRTDAHDIDTPVPSKDDAAEKTGGAKDMKAKSRIVVIGDSDFATNSFFHIMGNGKLFLNTINFLAAQENLIGVEPRTFDVPRVNMTNRQMKGTFALVVVLIPALLAAIGIVVWWKQR
ncbi:MAG: GldG family protein [Betaproteobacteria bacterium]|nr:GldG family protein [Betaproteobacteria bacterium]